MEPYKKKLLIPGLIITAIGCYDLYMQINRLSNDQSFRFGLNIIIAAVGILMILGNLKAAKKMAEIIAYFLLPLFGLAAMDLFRFPFKLSFIAIKNGALGFFNEFYPIVIFAFLLWLFFIVRAKPITDAMEAEGIGSEFDWKKPLSFGAIFWVLIVGHSVWFYYGDHGKIIKTAVAKQFGSQYKCWIHGYRTGTGGTFAKVYIYNEHEYKMLSVKYEKGSEVTITGY